MIRTRSLLLVAAALALIAVPATAEVFTVSLHNGTSFQTRYQPQAAPWDQNKILFLTDEGNWIALANADVAGVSTDTETKGFGYTLNTTTIALGWAPNDNEESSAEGNAKPAPAQQQQPNYTQQQFVEPSDTSGFPGNWVGYPTTGPGQVAPGYVVPPTGGAAPAEPTSPPR